jgi:hypothetical protein
MEKLVWEKAVEVVTNLTKGTNFVPQQNKTGVTFFEGKQRLVKIINSKKNLKLEINLELSKVMESKLEKSNGILTKITPALAHEKHLGTMKYLFSDNTEKEVKNIVTDLLKNYFKNDTEKNTENVK